MIVWKEDGLNMTQLKELGDIACYYVNWAYFKKNRRWLGPTLKHIYRWCNLQDFSE